MIGFAYHRPSFPGGYVLKTDAFGKVLPDQTVGVLVQAEFPGAVGMREIHVGV